MTGPIADSISSIPRTKTCSKHWDSGEFNISGFQNKDLRRRVEGKNTGQISRLMKRLRTHGLIIAILTGGRAIFEETGNNL